MGYILLLIICVITSLRIRDLFFQWVRLEVNILSVIPLLVVKMREDAVLNGLKYFISQRVASLVFILRALLGTGYGMSVIIITVVVLFKMGIPPLHSWLLRIIPSLGYSEMFILLRVQKFIPLIILRQLALTFTTIFILVVRSLVFTLLSLNKIGTISILIFLSSRRNGLWVLRSLFSVIKWVVFILTYTIILGVIIWLLKTLKIFKMNDMLNTGHGGSLMIGLQFLNMGGLPPFTGFMLKVLIIKGVILFRRVLTITLIFIRLLIIYLYTTTLYQVYCASDRYSFNPTSYRSVYLTIIWVLSSLGISSIIYFI